MRNQENSRKRRFESKRQAPANYLIICEGIETEPNYFKGLKQEINNKYGNKVDVLIPKIEVSGTGLNTTSLVEYTRRKVNYANKVYGKVWVVFDKDDYSDEQFNDAIKKCQKYGYGAAWSNPNIELWILSHFKKLTRYISKDEVINELSKEFQKNNLGEYKKNDEELFNKVTSDKKIDEAIKNCEIMEKLNIEGQASQRNPMTKVYKIVEGLKEYLE